jgi:hypothetical protein
MYDSSIETADRGDDSLQFWISRLPEYSGCVRERNPPFRHQCLVGAVVAIKLTVVMLDCSPLEAVSWKM